MFSRLRPDAPRLRARLRGDRLPRDRRRRPVRVRLSLRPLNGLKEGPAPPRDARALQYYAFPDWKFDRLRDEYPSWSLRGGRRHRAGRVEPSAGRGRRHPCVCIRQRHPGARVEAKPVRAAAQSGSGSTSAPTPASPAWSSNTARRLSSARNHGAAGSCLTESGVAVSLACWLAAKRRAGACAPRRGAGLCRVDRQGEPRLGLQAHALVGECQLADDRVVEGLEAGAVMADVVCAPEAGTRCCGC